MDCCKKKAYEEGNNDRVMATLEDQNENHVMEMEVTLVTFKNLMRVKEDELIKRIECKKLRGTC